MKKIKAFIIVITLCLISGCSSNKELKNIYDSMQINEKNINGYSMEVSLFGYNNDTRIDERVYITNYMNSSYLVKTNTNIYYLIKDKKYMKELSNTIPVFNEGVMERDISEYNGDIPFTNTNIYLTPLKKAKPDDIGVEEVINNITYKVYTFEVQTTTAKKMLEFTSLENESIVGKTYGKVYVDNNNYVYKIEYDYSTAFNKKDSMELDILFNSINSIGEISIYE